MRGMFIVIEGIDGCGKTTQLDYLRRYLLRLQRTPLIVRDPGGPAGSRLRELLLDKELPMDSLTQLLLFTAARRGTALAILESLGGGRDVLCDRWVLSTLMYQSKMGDITPQLVLDLHQTYCQNVLPDACVILDVPAVTAITRKATEKQGQEHKDRFESRGEEWLAKLGRAYKAQASVSELPPVPIVVDGLGTPEEVHRRVITALVTSSHKFAIEVATAAVLERPG